MPITLEKSIELVNKHPIQLKTAEDHDYFEALNLLVEAGKVYQKAQDAGWYPPGYKLPGETREEKKNQKVFRGMTETIFINPETD